MDRMVPLLTTERIARRSRVVIDNDWAGDPDGLVALAHHLLSPGHRVEAVTSSLLSPDFGPPAGGAAAGGAAAGASLAGRLIDLIGGHDGLRVHAGPDTPAGREERELSAAAEAIIDAARRTDPLPLVVACGGPLTNVAEALRAAPDIAGRMTLAWIGGASGDAFEYNRDTDPEAARIVRRTPALVRWEFPLETYRQCAISVAELEESLSTAGRLGAWLWERYTTLPLPEHMQVGAEWPLGDSCLLIGSALSGESSTWTDHPDGSRTCTAIDFRFLLGDMLALFRRHARIC
ncbi:hypothetical protein Q0Z83_043420 [Actinoplanes sichuanensis]|uniref:Nucleoside hydrolase n=1 Tax=Actinoplanes sichuanensis TaxID=512349 RepID=A0ABW4AJS9_9ACTN|nr:nucleoside hydrolase [Actinoplanes sichuanensis]BEL06151.1 hypothetical protein Q0Z83_043420 [Actinoplanes sichuanensis]